MLLSFAEPILASQCQPGYGPNDDHDGCAQCEGVYYSPIGECQVCHQPNVPIAGRTFCSPTVCNPGTTCLIDTCNEASDCADCDVGSVSMGGECEQCPGDGRVANAEQSLCESCFPGLEPMDDLSGCQGCTYNMFSQFGYGCLDCAAPAGKILFVLCSCSVHAVVTLLCLRSRELGPHDMFPVRARDRSGRRVGQLGLGRCKLRGHNVQPQW